MTRAAGSCYSTSARGDPLGAPSRGLIMPLLSRLEQTIGDCLDTLSRRLFGGAVSPRAIVQAVGEAVHSVRHESREVATNACSILLCDEDLTRLAAQLDTLRRAAAERIRETAAARGLELVGRPRVRLDNSPEVPRGEVRVTAALAPGPGEAELIELNGERRLRLNERIAVIGRDPACDLELAADGVSRRHARIEPRAEHYVLIDLGSTNGTKLNGSRISMEPLRSGNVVGIGPVRLEYREL